MAFLYGIYTRSAGDTRQGMPYEVLIDALAHDERVTKHTQRDLQRAGLVDLTTVPSMTHMSRPRDSLRRRQPARSPPRRSI